MRLTLRDQHSRSFRYLRLSITDVCNFRCSYCLPDGYQGCANSKYLSLPEIKNLAAAFVELGIQKIRLTGGEPTVRRDICEIIATLKSVDSNLKIALTTNGFLLPQLLRPLKMSGLDAINISLDSLRPDRFAQICGRDLGARVRDSVDAALEIGFQRVKINAVLLKGQNDDELSDYLEWLRDRPVSARFIELMRTTDSGEYFARHHLPTSAIQSELHEKGWAPVMRSRDDGPAIEFSHPDYKGRIGLIAPYGKGFCDSCNRLRISAQGGLRLCLFGEGDHSLRHLMQSPAQKDELIDAALEALQFKPKSHRLHENISGTMNSFSAIGG